MTKQFSTRSIHNRSMTQTQMVSVISRVLQKSLTISASWGVTLFG